MDPNEESAHYMCELVCSQSITNRWINQHSNLLPYFYTRYSAGSTIHDNEPISHKRKVARNKKNHTCVCITLIIFKIQFDTWYKQKHIFDKVWEHISSCKGRHCQYNSRHNPIIIKT